MSVNTPSFLHLSIVLHFLRAHLVNMAKIFYFKDHTNIHIDFLALHGKLYHTIDVVKNI
jgi:hypothetical protein